MSTVQIFNNHDQMNRKHPNEDLNYFLNDEYKQLITLNTDKKPYLAI